MTEPIHFYRPAIRQGDALAPCLDCGASPTVPTFGETHEPSRLIDPDDLPAGATDATSEPWSPEELAEMAGPRPQPIPFSSTPNADRSCYSEARRGANAERHALYVVALMGETDIDTGEMDARIRTFAPVRHRPIRPMEYHA